MDLEDFRQYCLAKKGVYEDFPFDDRTLVMKIGSKMFALTNIYDPVLTVNLKCDPLLALDLRREHAAVKPGYHMNKRHWNTVTADGTIPHETLEWMIAHSYDLVYSKLTRKEKEQIEKRMRKP